MAADGAEFMSDFFSGVNDVRISMKKIQNNIELLEEKYTEQLQKINPKDKKREYLLEYFDFAVSVWQDREFNSPRPVVSHYVYTLIACPNVILIFAGLGNEADQIVDDTNKIANEVKEKLELMVKTDTTGTQMALYVINAS